jgi:hypothetical protein
MDSSVAGCDMSTPKCQIIDPTGTDHRTIKLLYDKWLEKLVLVVEGPNFNDDGELMVASPNFDMTSSEVLEAGSLVTADLSADCYSSLQNIFIVKPGVFMSFPYLYDVAFAKYDGYTTGTIFPFLRYTVDSTISNIYANAPLYMWDFQWVGSINFMIEAGVVNYNKIMIQGYYDCGVDTHGLIVIPSYSIPPVPTVTAVTTEGAGSEVFFQSMFAIGDIYNVYNRFLFTQPGTSDKYYFMTFAKDIDWSSSNDNSARSRLEILEWDGTNFEITENFLKPRKNSAETSYFEMPDLADEDIPLKLLVDSPYFFGNRASDSLATLNHYASGMVANEWKIDPLNPTPMADFVFKRLVPWGSVSFLMEAEVGGQNLGIVVALNTSGCHSSCKYCDAPNDSKKCLECADPTKKLESGECLSSCPAGSRTKDSQYCEICPTNKFKF